MSVSQATYTFPVLMILCLLVRNAEAAKAGSASAGPVLVSLGEIVTMALGIGRGISTLLLALNFCMYMVTGALAGWALNKNIDSSAGAGGYVGRCCTPDSIHFEASFTWLISNVGILKSSSVTMVL
jgi:hypothetical protein